MKKAASQDESRKVYTTVGELVVIGGIAVVLIGAAAREVIGFVRWRIRLNRLERGEWDRVVRLLRD